VNPQTTSVPEIKANIQMKIRPDGAVICGQKTFQSRADSVRAQILQLMGRSEGGILSRASYQRELIMPHIPARDRFTGNSLVLGDGFHRRRNNVDKALSRLRQDLKNFFSDLVPDGTSWLYFSEKIDGWILFRLPGLGSDGQFHW
jgi:hypothetical protein